MSDTPPIITNRPRATKALANKYGPNGPQRQFLGSIGNPTLRALKRLDAQRANIGQSPLTKSETRVAGTAASQKRAVVPEPDAPWWQDAISDISDVAGAIPKLPALMANEVFELPSVGERYNKAISEGGGNPLETVGNLAQLPGVRLLPGSFTASQFGTGGQGVGGLTEHPVFTALDVLPYASKAARATPTFRAAQQASEATAAIEGAIPRRVSPFGANLKSFPRTEMPLQPSPIKPNLAVPTLARNPVGRALESSLGAAANTRLGGVAVDAFGKMARNEARTQNRIAGEVTQTTPETPLPPFADDLSRVAAEAVGGKGSERLATMREALGEERALAAEQAGRVGDPTLLRSLDTDQLEYVATARRMNDPFAEELARQGDISQREVGGTTDYYDNPTARRLDRARMLADRQVAVEWLRDLLNPKSISRASREEIVTQFRTAMDDASLKGKTREPLARGYLQALEDAGFDVRAARKSLEGGATKARLQALPDQVPDTPTREVLLTKTRSAERAKRLTELEGVRYTPGRMRQALRRKELVESTSVPARYEEAVRTRFDDNLRNELKARYSGDELNRAMSYLDQRAYQELARDFMPNIREFKREAQTSVQELRDAGFDPVFEHRVHPNSAHQYDFPRIVNNVPTLKQTRARLWESQPAISNYAISLDHRAMEILVKKGREYYTNEHLIPHMARKQGDLRMEYWDAAQARGVDVMDLVEAEWAPFKPNEFITNPRVQPATMNTADTLYLPKSIDRNFRRLTADPSDLARTGEALMKPFRTAVINLSPRLHLYNTLGGAIMLTLRAENPATVFKYLGRARRMAKEGGVSSIATDPSLSAAEQAAARLAPAAGREGIQFFVGDELPKSTNAAGRLERAHNAMAGKQLDTWLKSAWDAGATKTLRKGFNWTTAKSLWLNQYADDIYRSMAYMEGFDKALTKGMSREQAITAGIKKTREILQNFDTMTPLERTTMRFLMPFWSWSRTALRYAFTYPVDHPWRMSIISGFARAAMEDFNTGLPQYMKNWLFLGDTKSDGTVNAINLNGVNPFSDVANYFTLGGFLGTREGGGGAITASLNPLINTALQQFGVNTFSGQAELFPDVKYNPASGRLEALPKEGLISNLAGNLVPQARVLAAITGRSNQYKDLARRDPAAAGRFLASSIGLPSLNRAVDVPQETMKAELVRYNAFKDDLNSSLKSGNVGGLVDRYPALAAFKARISALTPEQRAKYAPAPGIAGAANPGYGDLAKGTIGAVVPGLG